MAIDTSKFLGDNAVKVESNQPPLIRIIQKGSAEFDEAHKKYKEKAIQGCRPGDLLFIKTGSILQRPVSVIPLRTQTLYAEWRPAKAGGGFIRHHPLSVVTEKGYSKDGNKERYGDNDLILTIYFFVLALVNQKWEKAIIPFTSTQLKHARRWAKVIGTHTDETFVADAPAYAALYHVSTQPESNNDGSWFGFLIEKKSAITALPEASAQEILDTAFQANREAEGDVRLMLAAPAEGGAKIADDDGNY